MQHGLSDTILLYQTLEYLLFDTTLMASNWFLGYPHHLANNHLDLHVANLIWWLSSEYNNNGRTDEQYHQLGRDKRSFLHTWSIVNVVRAHESRRVSFLCLFFWSSTTTIRALVFTTIYNDLAACWTQSETLRNTRRWALLAIHVSERITKSSYHFQPLHMFPKCTHITVYSWHQELRIRAKQYVGLYYVADVDHYSMVLMTFCINSAQRRDKLLWT